MDFEPEKEQVVRDLQPLIDHINRCLESAVDYVIDIYRQQHRPVNIQTLPDLVRDQAKYYLETYPLLELPYELEGLSRNGLSLFCNGLYYQGYHIKILKSDCGKLSIAGISRRKDQFFCQLPLPFALLNLRTDACTSNILPFQPMRSATRTILHLVFAWDIDVKTGMLLLALVCPKHVEMNRAVIYWEHRIEHAALRIAKEPMQPTPIYVEDPESYGISLPNIGELGNEQDDAN